jgi:hypothetical protein
MIHRTNLEDSQRTLKVSSEQSSRAPGRTEEIVQELSFSKLAAEYGISPSEVATLVIATGIPYHRVFNAKVVDAEGLPQIIPLLEVLRERKRDTARRFLLD